MHISITNRCRNVIMKSAKVTRLAIVWSRSVYLEPHLSCTTAGIVNTSPLLTGNPRRNSQVPVAYSLFLNGLDEYAQKVLAADLRDFIRGEAYLQHGIDDDIVETGRFILPCLIGAFPDARTLWTGRRTARTRPTRARSARRGTVRA